MHANATAKPHTPPKSYSGLPEVEYPPPAGDALYAWFRDLRLQAPLVKAPNNVLLSLHARNVERLFGAETRQLETEAKQGYGVTDGPIHEFIADGMLFSNGETHERRRRPIARALAFKAVEAMRPGVRALADRMVLTRRGEPRTDFLNDIAAQIPFRIVCDLVGAPQGDRPLLFAWIRDASAAIGPIAPLRRPAIELALSAFGRRIDALIADRRARPLDDFLTRYVAETATAADLGEGEIRAQIVGLILAGSDTTRNALCMILSRLLGHPDQWRDFCDDPEGLKRAVVEEGLRFDPIVSGAPRVSLQHFELDRVPIEAGRIITVSLISALRDPEVFAEPDKFDVHRIDRQRWHLAFGAGPHRCAGEALARVELEETLAAIAALAPRTSIVGEAPALNWGAIRTVDRMDVQLR